MYYRPSIRYVLVYVLFFFSIHVLTLIAESHAEENLEAKKNTAATTTATPQVKPPDIQQQLEQIQKQIKALTQQSKLDKPPFIMPKAIKLCGVTIDFQNPFIYRRVRREINEIIFKEGEIGNLVDLSGEFFPVIEPILAREGVPNDLKYLVAVESNFKVKAASYAGAKGPWQFITSSANRYGLSTTSAYYDERFNIELATEAAVKHLKHSYTIFEDWLLAITAYNKGDRGVNNVLNIHGIESSDANSSDSSQNSSQNNTNEGASSNADEGLEDYLAEQEDSNFWDLVLLVKITKNNNVVGYNNEQERYVPRVIAMKLILENIYNYDFLKFDPKNKYKRIPTEKVVVPKTMSSMDVAKALNMSLWNLKYLNPQYNGVYPTFPTNSIICLPKELVSVFENQKYQIKTYFEPKEEIAKVDQTAPKATPKPTQSQQHPKSAVVKSGETLWDISRQHGVPMKQLLRLNGLTYKKAKFIKAGQKIILR